ncbi:MAG TPA: FliH/SctL family protein [Rhodanobacteraceae bacterium]
MTFIVADNPTRGYAPVVIGGDGRAPTPAEMVAMPVAASAAAEATRADDVVAAQAEARHVLDLERDEARRAGREDGLREGREAGLAAARAEIASGVERERQAFADAVKALNAPWSTLQDTIAETIVGAALKLAKAIVPRLQTGDAEALKEVVDAVLQEALAVRGEGNVLRLYVGSGNKTQVAHWTREDKVEVVVDPKLGSADLRAELVRGDGDPVNRIDWDAAVATRWKAVEQALGL